VPQGTFVQVAERMRPTVVFIESARPQERREVADGLQRFFDFFGGEHPDVPEQQKPDQEQPDFQDLQRSQGSGVLVSADGYVLTNSHVVAAFNPATQDVDEATEVNITLWDDSYYTAEIVGVDLGTDIALLKIDAKGLQFAPLGNSDRLKVGEWVMAIGAPFGLQNTVSAGIVSALGRAVAGMPTTSYQDFVQTDAAINPGNSGGPLVNLHGEVIGINTAIATGGGFNPTFSGIGFAVPSNLASRVMDQLREHGHVVRGYLGVTVQPLSRELREAYGLDPRTRGAIVNTVTDGSPAQAAGLQPEDIVIAVDGEKLQSQQDFLQRIAVHAPGDRVRLTVIRGDEQLDLTVELTVRPDEAEIIASQLNLSPEAQRRRQGEQDEQKPSGEASELLHSLGLEVTDLTPRIAKQLRLPDEIDSGVVVSAVADNSPAALAGLERGDVILSVNRVSVSDVAQLEQVLLEKSTPGRPLALRIYDTSLGNTGLRPLRVPRK